MTANLVKQGYGVAQITEAASQWLHFIRPDYYVARALEEEGLEPTAFGFSSESSCYTGRCNQPFYTEETSGYSGGCGGMGRLIDMPAG